MSDDRKCSHGNPAGECDREDEPPMGDGTKMAAELAARKEALIDNMKEQLLIVFLKRLGGTVEIPVSEVDDTAQDLFAFSLDLKTRRFRFEIRRKE